MDKDNGEPKNCGVYGARFRCDAVVPLRLSLFPCYPANYDFCYEHYHVYVSHGFEWKLRNKNVR